MTESNRRTGKGRLELACAIAAFEKVNSVLAKLIAYSSSGSNSWQLMLLFLAIVPVSQQSITLADNDCQVDVPAVAIARELLDPFVEIPSIDEQLIELEMNVSLRCEKNSRKPAYAYEIEAVWARSVYPIVDYWPKTIMHSPIQGLIEIERKSEKSARASLATQKAFTSLPATAEIGGLISEQFNRRYSEVPDRELWISSGTVQRGTGAFVRFHNTSQQTLEGSRTLTLVYRVPTSWRGGLMRIKTTVIELDPNSFSWSPTSPRIETYLVPVYLEGDIEAHDAAIAYAQAEADAKSKWRAFLTERQTRTLAIQLANWMRQRPSKFTDADVEQLLNNPEQDISEGELDDLSGVLSPELLAAIAKFTEARKRLMALSRQP